LVYLYAVVLAVIEGVTEFLPVSSTGHLILAEQFLSLEAAGGHEFTADFEVIIQLPAILAVVVYFWRSLWPFGKEREEQRRVWALWLRVMVAFIPAAVLGFLLDDFIEAALFNPYTVAIALLVGGALLIAIEKAGLKHTFEDVHDVTYAKALAIGFFQCLAMIPGTSRSAATIIGAMVLGAKRPAAAEFSFFLAIPTMFGATVLKMAKAGLSYTGEQWAILAVGSVVSFLTAWAVIAMFMRYIQTRDFVPFGVYRIILGVVVLVYFWLVAGDVPPVQSPEP